MGGAVPGRGAWHRRAQALHRTLNPARVAERAARESYGRLLAQLAARTRDVAAAEDALSDAFAAALKSWPQTGAPDNPEAWLFQAARRKLIDGARRAATAKAGERELARASEEIEAEMAHAALPDRRLGLLFACAHPAIDPAAHTPLMLQAVLGLSAERIAAAFLVQPAAMGQRLVRAKAKIAEAGIGFDVPSTEEWDMRLPPVLAAVYAAYGEGWADATGADAARRDLTEEAVWLARVLAQQMPQEPEAAALLALMLMLEARRPARRDAQGAFVALDAQDVRLWRRELMGEAMAILARLAPSAAHAGRYQLEAAIQHAHLARAFDLPVDHAMIAALYERLAALTGSPVARLNAIAARARILHDVAAPAEAMLAALGALAEEAPALLHYQPFWALKADLCAKAGQTEDARAAYGEAIAREKDAAVIAFLSAKRAAL